VKFLETINDTEIWQNRSICNVWHTLLHSGTKRVKFTSGSGYELMVHGSYIIPLDAKHILYTTWTLQWRKWHDHIK